MRAEFNHFWHDGVHFVYFNRTIIVFADFLQRSETFFFFLYGAADVECPSGH